MDDRRGYILVGLKVRLALVALLMLTATPLMVAGSTTAKASSYTNLIVQAQRFLTREANLRHWTITSQSLKTLEEQSYGNSVTYVYLVTQNHLLDYASPQDTPVLEGLLAGQRAANRTSPGAASAVQGLVAQWEHNLQRYITTPATSYEYIEVIAALTPSGAVAPGTATVFEQDPLGNWVPAATILAGIPSASAVSASAARGIQLYALDATPNVYCCGGGSSAVSYANQYSDNGSLNVDCGGTMIAQWPRYYNGSYSYYQCNDCTNYMSQALFYGGIPETSTWKPYTSAWINVNAFYNYMSSKGYLSQTSVSSVPAGGLVTFGPIGSMTHTEMVVYNDGSTQEYSGHTTDRDQYSYSYSFTGAMWWVVNY